MRFCQSPRLAGVFHPFVRVLPQVRRALATGLVLASCVGANPVHAGYSFTPLGDLAGGSFSSVAQGVSADGSVVAGYSNSASGTEAFRWTSGGGMVGLGDLPGGSFNSQARGVSADGSVIVGFSNSASGQEAFRWTSGGGMVGLGDLAGGIFSSSAHGVSADGSVVVGTGRSASGFEAFRWTSGGGMVGLGDLTGGAFQSEAADVSADGAYIVGFGLTGLGAEAFFWSQNLGMVRLVDLLLANGVSNLTGWTLSEATAISADGHTIVGYGINPQGFNEAFVVTVPETSTFVLTAFGSIGLAALVRRRRG